MNKILIIGASAAAIAAAKEIRKITREAELTLITEEAPLPYYRPFLTEYVGDTAVTQKPNFYLNPETWYRDNNIALMLGEKVVQINPAAKTVATSKAREFAYDKLILANGSTPFVPFPGLLEKENVFAIRTFDDAKKVEQYANNVRRVTVIGGGLLGLETVHSLLKKKLEITIIEFVNRILPMQLDEDGSRLLEATIAKQGVTLKLNASADSFTGQTTVSAVTLKSGEVIPTDMVVCSIGVRANLELARQIGLTTNRGIVVNEKMETSQPDIYACGDVAEFGRNAPLWTVALEQGKIAGLNAIGESAVFKAESYPARLNAFDLKIYSIGDLGRNAPLKNYITLGRKNPDEQVYKQLYFAENKLTGGLLMGDVKKATALAKAVNQGLSPNESIALLD